MSSSDANSGDESSIPILIENKHIDELTMKLLTNKTNYAKYLAITDEQKHEKHQRFVLDCIEHSADIVNMTRIMCKGENNEYGSNVSEAFDVYAQTLIRYLEVKQRSDEIQQGYDAEDELFPHSMDEEYVKPKMKTKPTYNERRSTLDYFVRK
jgi:hypothetical protein